MLAPHISNKYNRPECFFMNGADDNFQYCKKPSDHVVMVMDDEKGTFAFPVCADCLILAMTRGSVTERSVVPVRLYHTNWPEDLEVTDDATTS
jgi:hypothetical protein